MLFARGSYNKANGVTPMKTHVDYAQFCLVVKRKLILIKKSMAKHVDSYFNQQLGMKKVGSSWSTITTFFGSTNLYKHGDEPQQRFFENFVDYIYKRYKHLLTCENMLL